MTHVRVVTCTQMDKDGFMSRPLGRSLDVIGWTDIDVFYENSRGLSECYNEALDRNDGAILVFIHDDVEIIGPGFDEVVSGEEFDIMGLAGTSSWVVRDKALWHFSDRDKWSGCVWHDHGGRRWRTDFGEVGRRCIVLDGLFLAVHPNVTTRFDQCFRFHHYDLDFCLSAHADGFTMGTVPIDVIHHSIGDWNSDPEWFRSNDEFMRKWKGD